MQRRWTACLVVAACLLCSASAPAQEDVVGSTRADLYTPATDAAVEGALRWLKMHQNADGSWNAKVGFKINDGYRLQPQNQNPDEGLPHLGVTSLAAMAFLSGGHLPGQGPYGDVMDKALSFVLGKVNAYGYITAYETRMYSHAFSLLFLAEVYGMTGRPDLRKALDRAVEFTYKSQNRNGGWRYAPLARDSDMSITVCQVVALREARNIGIKVPKSTIDEALKYVIKSAVTNGGDRGAFLYQRSEVPFNRNSFALTAAGLTTIQQAGLYSDRAVSEFCRRNGIENTPRISDCVSYLQRSYGQVWIDYSDHYFYFYGNYYAAQAMYTRGGAEWDRWYARIRNNLLQVARNSRDKDGLRRTFWSSKYVGNAFSTAVAAIILQVPKHYLPIFQR